MEAQLYRILYKLVCSLAHPLQRRTRFNDRIVVIVCLWPVLWDRPVCWACDPKIWGGRDDFAPPSDSTMPRRLRTVSVQQLLERAPAAGGDLFGPAAPPPLVKQVDGKPMYVGPYSKDRDAKRGRWRPGRAGRGRLRRADAPGAALPAGLCETFRDIGRPDEKGTRMSQHQLGQTRSTSCDT